MSDFPNQLILINYVADRLIHSLIQVMVPLITHLNLVPTSRIRGAIPPLPNTPSWRGVQLKHREKFTFNLTISRHRTTLDPTLLKSHSSRTF
jgi:hypothetical protein